MERLPFFDLGLASLQFEAMMNPPLVMASEGSVHSNPSYYLCPCF